MIVPPWCQKHGVAYPHLRIFGKVVQFCLMFFVPQMIRVEVTLMGDMSRGLESPKEHTTRCTPHLADYITGSTPQWKGRACRNHTASSWEIGNGKDVVASSELPYDKTLMGQGCSRTAKARQVSL